MSNHELLKALTPISHLSLRERGDILEDVIIPQPDYVFISLIATISFFVGKNSILLPNTYLVGNVIIGENCIIGPETYLEEVEIGDNSEIGFTAQLKRVKTGKHFVAKHHCYLGDAEIGDDVNIGAGAITANYDGLRKLKTDIGHGAFVGTNVNLVAPIKIGNEAMIAAGSTIDGSKFQPKNSIAPHSLVVARPEHHISESTLCYKVKKGYQRVKKHK